MVPKHINNNFRGCMYDACKMHTWTLSFIILNSHIFATYIMIISCFTLIYEDLPMILFIWFITPQNRKSLFRLFFTFRDLYGVKLTCDFWSVTFSSEESPLNFEADLDGPEAQKRTGGAPTHGGHATLLFQPSIVQLT
jgi:hypothetical protein